MADNTEHGKAGLSWTTRSPGETSKAGAEFSRMLKSGDVVGLVGELGSGKTCFVKGAVAALGCDAAVSSPTYALCNVYPGSPNVAHFDVYRLKSPDELLHIGFEDYLSGGYVCFVEWADKVAPLMPRGSSFVRFTDAGEHTRHIVCGPFNGETSE